LVEAGSHKPEVTGSNPVPAHIFIVIVIYFYILERI
jgi:hypothetical protein